MPRRFPPPWRIERIEGGYKVLDAEGQSLAYVYGTAATEEIARPPRRRAWQTRSPEGECSRASIEIGAHPLLQGGVGCASIKPTIGERVPEGGSGRDAKCTLARAGVDLGENESVIPGPKR